LLQEETKTTDKKIGVGNNTEDKRKISMDPKNAMLLAAFVKINLAKNNAIEENIASSYNILVHLIGF
jgi:hypothetical protein